MTDFNNKFVPSVPKTYTVSELRDQQQQQLIKKSNLSVAARNKVINRSSSNYLSENQGGYGPCSYANKDCDCYVPQGYIPLCMACPSCTNNEPNIWVHSGGDCGGPAYICPSLYLQCKKCHLGGYWWQWKFGCPNHEGYQYATSTKNFAEAVRLGMGLQACNPYVRLLAISIAASLRNIE